MTDPGWLQIVCKVSAKRMATVWQPLYRAEEVSNA